MTDTRRIALAAAVSLLSTAVVGCAVHPSPQVSPVSVPLAQLHGRVHGGQQPVTGATLQLYAANITSAAGASTPMLTVPVFSDLNGNFSITGDYSCPVQTATPVYLVATGGNPGLVVGTNNAAITLMAALGPCNALTASTFVDIDEVTTVAAAFGLGTSMTDAAHVGGSTLAAATAAFTLAAQLANTATGTAPGAALAANSFVPSAKLNTLADILATCVNTDGSGSTGSTTPCGMLFTDTAYGGAMPANTLAAAIDVAANPATGVAALFSLAGAASPFQPALSSAPANWLLTIATLSWPVPAGISASIPLGSTQLDATATVSGAFAYSPTSGTVLSAGSHTLSVTFTPADTVDYPTIASSVSLAVNNPSYTFGNVAIVGGGYVDGIVVHPTAPNVRYARTDVGGAYKWNPATSAWVPLTDFISDTNRAGCESIALDPTNSNNVYLAMGEYSESYGENGLFLISTDGFNTFTQVTAPFKMGSNDPGRTAGERMAVDPNLPTKLYYGSYRDGLWVSTNSGSSWSKVSSFPVYSTTTGGAGTGGVPPGGEDYTGFAGAGVVFVQFVGASGTSGSATPVIYVGVSDTGASGTGYSSLYVSTNGGATWTAVAGQPTGAYPIRSSLAASAAGANTLLYIAYSSGPLWANSTTITQGIGPDSVNGGFLYKYTLPPATSPGATGGTWTNITPGAPARASGTQGGFASIVADPNNLGVVMATTLDDYYPGDDIYRSLNYGQTWESVLRITHATNPATTAGATYNTSLSPWITFGGTITSAGTWPTSLVIDPANSNHVLYGTGQTLWDSTNIQNADSAGTVTFNIGASGIEETVAQALSSPPTGPLLVSGVDDLGGFVHTSLTSSPANGMILNDAINPIDSIDFAQNLPTSFAFIGNSTTGGYSTNSGSTWTKFSAAPTGTTKGQGQIAVSANGSTFVWATADAPVAYTTNNGTTWTASTGATAENGVVSDRINTNKFYIYATGSGSYNGTLQLSTNAGQSFTTVATGLANYAVLGVSPAAEGDLWLGSSTNGLFHSTNSGTSFAAVAGFNYVNAIGFGAAASGGSYPAIYVIGTSSAGTYGFFRSVDKGSTWTRINDANHQWGYTRYIIGDPKTFGRFYVTTGGRGVVYGDSPY
jgi:xyloglucan-specific exo-beta-1,4-glucanase